MKSTRTNHGWAAVMVAAILMMLAAAMAAPAQTFTTLVNFNGADGSNPNLVSLAQGPDGSLYGTTAGGGAFAGGSVFKVSPAGTLTTLYSFCAQTNCSDGFQPDAGLVLGTDGSFFGTTQDGGNPFCSGGCGTIFEITQAGILILLHSFDYGDGAYPTAGLVMGTDGNFYGTTLGGGTGNSCSYANAGCGTVFRITPQGSFTTLHDFNSIDGALPYATLIQGTDGNFYGTTLNGGISNSSGYGTVFSITPGGTLTTLHAFDGADGATPFGGALIQASDGSLYGTTTDGGDSNPLLCPGGCGTVFRITLDGTLTTLHSFCSHAGQEGFCFDGARPFAGILLATNGTLYGTTAYGGAVMTCNQGCGTIFSITTAGSFKPLHSFDGSDGSYVYGELVQDTDGAFYGTTYGGGSNKFCTFGCGTVFSLYVGLGPFVETEPTFGNAGETINILGTNLTRASSVTFNGTPATFIVELPTGIKATVPTGATTGPVQVVTPSGTLISNVNFQVQP